MSVPITLSNNTPADADDVMANFDSLDADITAKGAPTGSMLLWTTNTPPSNWLIADGSAVSRATYAALYSVIGTTYGSGDGSTTFNLPNLKGSVPVGRDTGQTEFDTLAETGGAKTHTLTIAEIPSHYHTTQLYGDGDAGAGAYNANSNNSNASHTVQSDSKGGGGAHNNLQPYIVINFIIKT